jgi:hypothetical protein
MAKNPYINIYGGDVTEGGTDGTLISCDGSFFYPISMLFDVSKPDINLGTLPCVVSKFAFRTEPGYKWSDLYITVTDSDLYSAWYLSWSSTMGNYSKSIFKWGRGASDMHDVNTVFYLALGYFGRKWSYDYDKFLDHFYNGQDTGINISAKIAPIGFEY